MGANIIQFFEIISLNSLACIEHTDKAKTSTFTPLSNVWGVRVDLGLFFESTDRSWIFMCAYIKQF